METRGIKILLLKMDPAWSGFDPAASAFGSGSAKDQPGGRQEQQSSLW